MDVARTPRILVVKLSSLGDLFHALPAVHTLRTALGAEVDWVVQAEYRELVGCFTDVADVIPFERRAWARGLGSFLRRLRSRRYELVVDLQGLLKSALIARASRGARRIGPSFAREGSALLYDEVAGPRNRDRHAVEENLDVVRHLGLPVQPAVFPLRLPAVPLGAERPKVGMAPVSRWVTKNWPVERFAAAAALLRQRTGAAVYLFGGAGDRGVTEAVRARAGDGVTDLAGRLSLVEAAGALAAMDVVVANDSGLLHLAAAAGVPVVGIFGATSERRTGPYGPGHRILRAAVPCAPCLRRTCAIGRLQCLEQIPVERVVEAAEALLERRA
jgi:lipopolysaccharide heptosyltransferase I